MPRNGSGTYNLPAGNPVVTGTTISSTTQNTTMSDVASALTNSVSKDGQTTMTGNLPMGGFKVTGLAVGTAATDSANISQVQSGVSSQLVSVSGADTILAFGSPSVASYATGAKYTFIAASNNTGAATINVDSLGAKAITKYGTDTLIADDIVAGAEYFIVYDGTRFQLLNPSTLVINDDAITITKLADSTFGISMTNGYFTAIVSGNALTMALKTMAGTDPSATDPVAIVFRSSTITNGGYYVRFVTSALSITVSNGSTLGTISATQSQLSLLAIDNAGAVELAIANDTAYTFYDEQSLISTTAEGGAGAADSANVAYSTTARTNVPFRNIAYVQSTQATAGTWATAPSKLALTTASYFARRPLIQSSAVATTSGTSQDITGAPSFAKRITVTFNRVSLSGTANILIQLIVAGTPVTSGYDSLGTQLNAGSTSTGASSTAGFLVSVAGATNTLSGQMVITNVSGNIWVASHSGRISTNSVDGGGDVTLAGTITGVRITSTGADTLDGGSFSVIWE